LGVSTGKPKNSAGTDGSNPSPSRRESAANLTTTSNKVGYIASVQLPHQTYRAPGRYEGSFFCERLIELTARDLGIDSAEMRERNLIAAGEMPYPLPRLEPVGPAGNTECDSGDYRETLERYRSRAAIPSAERPVSSRLNAWRRRRASPS